ncbi:MAG: DnaJ domain-containing protein [Acidobacteriota bacterium]
MSGSSLNKDFYSVLGVARDASPKAIKQRFRELARERHPDRFTGEEKARAERDFQDITEAFNVLTDPVRRRQVDLALARPAEAKHDPADITRVYLNRGIRAYKQGNFIDAANNFDRATQNDPRNAQAWHHLTLTCMKETRWLPRAQEAIERACELRPEHVPYLKLAGRVFAESKMTAKARQYYNQALKVGGQDTGIRRALEQLGGARHGGASGPGDSAHETSARGTQRRTAESKEPENEKSGSLFRKIW